MADGHGDHGGGHDSHSAKSGGGGGWNGELPSGSVKYIVAGIALLILPPMLFGVSIFQIFDGAIVVLNALFEFIHELLHNR